MIESKKKDIRKMTPDQIKDFLTENGEKGFRAKQIQDWLWKSSAKSFDEMTNLSKKTRELLQENFEILPVTTFKAQKSNDGTIKSAFQLHDKHLVEGVLIPAEPRMTACISSQVGCSLTCSFCATGYMDRKRNLDAAEIYDQVVAINDQAMEAFNTGLTNIVYMGMGEPLLNYKNMMESVEKITSPNGLGMSAKRITVSTAGIAKMIRKLGDDEVKFNLALSLHAANDEKRNQIMPINEQNTLEVLREALKYYFSKTKNPVTYEYIVFNNFNDSLKDAEELYQFTRHLPSKVNIIEYNPISEADFLNAKVDKIQKFADYLSKKGVNIHVRRSRGKDIDAACGQLANKNK
ncbi:23S rRNA (adenine(2503)-C(2))-methyltransferase RlmN [Flammeovirga pectinis]|uniref:Probable dual-specificity RNA methyltransferase RlmN n=1 Tax=Flammeovirga pectinis TaxID=2494373 RepID=A0A3S9P894_9BACT|nr:23S rRNA (adenine(2503)-C(2))-methyltransferase RlmN [Flammeovirga pectinis]AZQ64374.1 23S rRNA (adenine(2503)-C(2))-methyltransferase RlmN [Flammeovirga pectinis]